MSTGEEGAAGGGLLRVISAVTVQACGEKHGTVMRTTHYSTQNTLLLFFEQYDQATLDTIMTSRINAAHTTCPGCQEEVYLDELVKGRCPLCGCTLEELDEHDHELDEFIDRSDLPWLVFNYFLFKRFLEMGASPLQVMHLANGYNDHDDPANGQKPDTKFILEVPRGFVDRVRPKRCARCKRLYISGGKKVVSGDLATPEFEFLYYCPEC